MLTREQIRFYQDNGYVAVGNAGTIYELQTHVREKGFSNQ